MAKPILKEIKTSELVVDKFNVRGDDWDNDEELVDSIKSQGVLEPLLVRPVKSQKEKYPKNKTYSIVCGGRRWHGAMEGRLKTVPCVIRNDLSDLTTLGTSLAENIERNSLTKFQESQGYKKMWDMMNGGKTYEQKMKDMKKIFGKKESTIKNYINIAELGEEILESHRDVVEKVDTNTLAGISTEKDWDEEEKVEAIEKLSEIESSKERRAALWEMKSRADEQSPAEALESIKKEMKGLEGINITIWLNFKEKEATIKAAKKNKIEMETLVKKNHVKWLKDNNFLK
jgi:ParB/RepB/Spo0J family partition protein